MTVGCLVASNSFNFSVTTVHTWCVHDEILWSRLDCRPLDSCRDVPAAHLRWKAHSSWQPKHAHKPLTLPAAVREVWRRAEEQPEYSRQRT